MVLKCFTYNQHFVAMMNIINYSRLNPPESGHKHHIIPKCWFRMNNLPIDNSKKGMHWFNNGTINVCAYTCPEGFVKGRLKNV